MRLNFDTDAIAQRDLPAALAQLAAAQSALAARLLSVLRPEPRVADPHDADPLLTAAQAAARCLADYPRVKSHEETR
jgi:hypothetical protein